MAVQYETKILAATPNATFASFDTPTPSGSCRGWSGGGDVGGYAVSVTDHVEVNH